MEKFIADMTARCADLVVDYAPRLAGALLLLWVGSMLIRSFLKFINKLAGKREWDPTLRNFMIDLANVALKIMLLLSVASMLGFETTSFVAVLGAAGLAVGLALQGSLSNFAGGVLILMFRPFRVGDLIDTGTHNGFVTSINIFVTTLVTGDNRVVILPNGPLANGSLINYSTRGYVRIDIPVVMDNDNDFNEVKPIIVEALKKLPMAMQDKGVSAVISSHNAECYTVLAQAHCRPEDIVPLSGLIAETMHTVLADRLKPIQKIHVVQG